MKPTFQHSFLISETPFCKGSGGLVRTRAAKLSVLSGFRVDCLVQNSPAPVAYIYTSW
jgi:hypothetical protein